MSVSNRPQLPAQNIILETEKAISKRWNPQINWPFYGFIKEIKTCEIRGLGSVFAETKWKKTAL
ncbi:MAG: hypothetical protein WCS95_07745 [Lentisphaeria bacterium]